MFLKKSLLVFFIFSLSGCSYLRKDIKRASPVLKILISTGQFFKIQTAGNYEFQSEERKIPGKGPFIVSVTNQQIEINGIPFGKQIFLIPSRSFKIKDRSYRGTLQILQESNEVLLINEINIEDYLLSVLPSEVPVSWNSEALKAQAVVARTYALFEMKESRIQKRPFDLYSSTRSQVYKGISVENKYTSAAVYATLGEVVTWKGKIAKTYFHASSGGMTESSRDAFNDPRPYLKVISSPYGKNYRFYRWSTNLSVKTIESRFKDLLQGHLKGIAVSKRTPSKRIATVVLIDEFGTQHPLSGNKFRSIIGARTMRSTRANIQIKEGKINISGVGYGHGVGMGQWDAQDMANQNQNYQKIIAFFYPGTRIQKFW